MKISDILKTKRTLSFEVFPPKKENDDLKKMFKTIDEIKTLNPDFISVTYGAMGNTKRNTAAIASYIKSIGIEPLAHLTGGPSTKEEIDSVIADLKNKNVENLLLLRGDKPIDSNLPYCEEFKHATDLLEYLSDDINTSFCAAGACYPEGHQECDTLYEDLVHMKEKERLGASFFITQIFYDNNYYYRLVNEARRIGIKSPIIPGIMPLVNPKNIARIKNMCGASIPLEFRNMLEVYKDNPLVLEEIGINYAVYQIIDLVAKGAPGVHLYIMNNAKIAKKIYERLENVFKELF